MNLTRGSRPLRALLRGVSQIFFVRNALAGGVILVALALSAWYIAALVALGVVVQTAGAVLVRRDTSEIDDGLMGYNGALVGGVLALDLGPTGAAVLLTVLGALVCIPIHEIVRRVFAAPGLRRFGLPVATAPFCIVASILYGAIVPLIVAAGPTTAEDPLTATVSGFFQDFSEVVLADGPVPGLLILVALLIGSWRIGLAGALGSALAVVLGLAIREPADDVSAGLVGYSAVLAAIGLAVVVRAEARALARWIAGTVGVALTILFHHLFAVWSVPAYTWPFLLALWLVLILWHLLGQPRHGRTSWKEASADSL